MSFLEATRADRPVREMTGAVVLGKVMYCSSLVLASAPEAWASSVPPCHWPPRTDSFHAARASASEAGLPGSASKAWILYSAGRWSLPIVES